MKHFFVSVSLAATFLASCGSETRPNDTANNQSTTSKTSVQASSYTPPPGVDAKVAASLKPVIANYLTLKNALAADNGSGAANAGKALLTALDGVDTVEMTSKQSATYTELADDMKEHAEHTAANAGKIDHQRMHFEMLSKDIYDLVKIFGGGQHLYHAHCPMAFDGKGASWISEFKEIKNPYFGDQMLECGEVKEEIK